MSNPSLAALCGLLLRIGATSFGAHMALLGAVQKEVVERRALLSKQDWSDILALVSALPGPMAVNAVACLGHRLHGTLGAIAATLTILTPSVLVMTLFASVHAAQADAPLLRMALSLMPAAVAAIVLAAAMGLHSLALSAPGGRGIALAAALACLLAGGHGITWMLLVAALTGLFLARQRGERSDPTANLGQALRPALAAGGVALLTLVMAYLPMQQPSGQLFFGFAQLSLFMFGGGYTAVPLFQELAVIQHHWVSERTLADAIALSQLTPGPIMTSAGFIGQQVAGVLGNAAAVAGMFLPMAVISVLALHSLRSLDASWWMRGILAGVRPAALGVIAGTGLLLATRLPDKTFTLPVFALSLYLLLGLRLPTYWLVPVVALLGLALGILSG